MRTIVKTEKVAGKTITVERVSSPGGKTVWAVAVDGEILLYGVCKTRKAAEDSADQVARYTRWPHTNGADPTVLLAQLRDPAYVARCNPKPSAEEIARLEALVRESDAS